MKKEEIDYFEDEKVVSVMGQCKKCGSYRSINKDGLCVRCR